jgi:hypothetical protein
MDLFETLGLGPRPPEENELYVAIYADPAAAEGDEAQPEQQPALPDGRRQDPDSDQQVESAQQDVASSSGRGEGEAGQAPCARYTEAPRRLAVTLLALQIVHRTLPCSRSAAPMRRAVPQQLAVGRCSHARYVAAPLPAPVFPLAERLESLRQRCAAWLLTHTAGYVWNREPLLLRSSAASPPPWSRPRRRRRGEAGPGVADGEAPGEGCVWAVMRFGDAVDDEWWAVWLLLRLSRELQDLSVQVRGCCGVVRCSQRMR